MTCAGCGADPSDLAVAFERRHHPCCHQQAFVTLHAACSDLATTISGLPADARDDVVLKVLGKLLKKPATEQLETVGRTRAYIRKALRHAWKDELRRIERQNRLLSKAPPPPPPEEPEEPGPGRAELALGLEAVLAEASLGLRGSEAREGFLRRLRGLIDLHLRDKGSRADHLAAEGLDASKVNVLEKAQERDRAKLLHHLLERARAARAAADADEQERLRHLSRAVSRLKGPKRPKGPQGG